MTPYEQFLREKIRLASFDGFDVPIEQINPAVKPHTRDIARWCLQGGNRAVFASFGLHKTAKQIEILRQIGLRYPDALRLQVLPLGVRQEFTREAALRFTGDCAVDMRFIRRDSEGRRGGGSELSAAYFADQVHYLQAAERGASMPTLFDLDPIEEAACQPS
jgi:hypothetical protein